MLHQKQYNIKQEIVPTVEYLICALLALTPNEYLFKRLRIKIDIYRYKTSLITNEETITEFYKLLKKPSIKVLAISLISKIRYKKRQLDVKSKDFYLQETLLKKYLQKFYYLYLRYFFTHNKTYRNAPTVREINILAIKALILIVGV